MALAANMLKCALNTLNGFMLLSGILMIAVASFSINSAPSGFIYLNYLIGGVSLIAALIGCCGICKEHVCLTTTYAAILLVSVLIQVGGRIWANDSAIIRKFARDEVNDAWKDIISHPNKMDKIQSTYRCCGPNSHLDYVNARLPTPDSCYSQIAGNRTMFQSGCIMEAERQFTRIFNYSSTTSWISLGVAICMCIGAVYLVIRFRNKERRSNY